jgi:hypothetical protein
VSSSTRSCGSCTLCCKLFPVPDLGKPSGQWCQHIAQGKGCGIHETRPSACRAFWCQWIENEELGPEWKPEVSKFVLSIYPGSNSLVVTVDPASPVSWRKEPYLSQLRRWSSAALAQGDQVVVFRGDHGTAILPDRDIELGRIQPSDRLVTLRRGMDYSVEVRR